MEVGKFLSTLNLGRDLRGEYLVKAICKMLTWDNPRITNLSKPMELGSKCHDNLVYAT